MLRALLHRPVAVLVSFTAAAVFSAVALGRLPVALLPDADVPRVVVRLTYPNAAPEQVEQRVLRPLRVQLATLAHLEELTSQADAGRGRVEMRFAYGTRMDLATLAVNEQIDRLVASLPRQVPRPLVTRLRATDLPVLRVQVTPKTGVPLAEASAFTERVLRRRLEALPGVSLVDLGGAQRAAVAVRPDAARLAALGLTPEALTAVVQDAGQELGALEVDDGPYTYLVQLETRLQRADQVAALPLRLPDGGVVRLGQVARVVDTTARAVGYHLYQGRPALALAVHAQTEAQLLELVPRLHAAVAQFERAYPQLDFAVTQDQSALLRAGIDNLRGSLLFGGLFAFAVLFLFMRHWRLPVVIGVALPVSLLLSFGVFYLVGLTVNVISLAGLALGLGMLIDNAIIVIDNVTRHQQAGRPLDEACAVGTQQVVAPLLSAVLTTLAVFVPLVFLSGLAGALFTDQALAVAAILGVSLVASFVLVPLLYRLLFLRVPPARRQAYLNGENRAFVGVLAGYEALYARAARRPGRTLALLGLTLPAGVLAAGILPVRGLPELERYETQVDIAWNEPIDVTTNHARVVALSAALTDLSEQQEAGAGAQQFLLQDDDDEQRAELYLRHATTTQKARAEAWLRDYFQQRYPRAAVEIGDAPNAFEQLFADRRAWLEVKFRPTTGQRPVPPTVLLPLADSLAKVAGVPLREGAGLRRETVVTLQTDLPRLQRYGVPYAVLREQLRRTFGHYLLGELQRDGEALPLLLAPDAAQRLSDLRRVTVASAGGTRYPLGTFVTARYATDYATLTADRAGLYQHVEADRLSNSQRKRVTEAATRLAAERGLRVTFGGRYRADTEQLRALMVVFAVSVLLLYFILAAQFESLWQPLLVLFTLPLGAAGSALALSLSGGSLNVMAAIGGVVTLGIMVNDAILKVDTINRLRREVALDVAVHRAGVLRLKPILMTSATTVLALLPVVYSSGLGADLQRPLVWAVVGGLTVGTGTALFFVPLAYLWVAKRFRL